MANACVSRVRLIRYEFRKLTNGISTKFAILAVILSKPQESTDSTANDAKTVSFKKKLYNSNSVAVRIQELRI